MSTTIRIAIWNLQRPRKSSARNDVLREHIRAINADIWILTETHEQIVPSQAHRCAASPVQPWRSKGEHSTVIWSRFPITRNLPTFPSLLAVEHAKPNYSVSAGSISPAVCGELQTPIGPLIVYGTIITWYNDKGPMGTTEGHEEYYGAIEAHGRDWSNLDPALPRCVAGDFNTTLNDRNYPTKCGRKQLELALQSNDLKCVTNVYDYNIDHICLSPDWAAQVVRQDQWAPPLYGRRAVSDHAGCYVDLQI